MTKTEPVSYTHLLKDDFTNASIKLQQQKKEYKEFSSAMDIRQKKERQQVVEYGKSIAQKSVWASKKVGD